MRRTAHTTRPSLPCGEPHCPEPSVRDGRCAAHVRAADLQHNREHADYHASDYRRARAAQLEARGYCAVQLTAPSPCDGMLTVHHLDHNRRNNDRANLETLCLKHHMQLEREHRVARGGPVHTALERAWDGHISA